MIPQEKRKTNGLLTLPTILSWVKFSTFRGFPNVTQSGKAHGVSTLPLGDIVGGNEAINKKVNLFARRFGRSFIRTLDKHLDHLQANVLNGGGRLGVVGGLLLAKGTNRVGGSGSGRPGNRRIGDGLTKLTHHRQSEKGKCHGKGSKLHGWSRKKEFVNSVGRIVGCVLSTLVELRL